MPEEISSKKTKHRNPEKEMTFWEHLEELRWNLLRSVTAVIILTVVAFMNKEFLFDTILLAPKSPDFITYRVMCRLATLLSVPSLCPSPAKFQIVNLSMPGQLITHLTLSAYAGLILASPYVIWEIWRFIKPALLPKEKKYAGTAVVVCCLLFILGVCFSYFILVPIMVNFFGTYIVSDQIQNQISLTSYLSTVTSMNFTVGLIFELPVFAYFLTKVGILTPKFMRKTRRYAILIILIVAAIVTPPDALSQVIVSIPMLILYELSIFVSKMAYKNKLAG